MTVLIPILAGIGALCMSNPRRRRLKASRLRHLSYGETFPSAKQRKAVERMWGSNPSTGLRDLTDHEFNIGSAHVRISTWRNKNATAFVSVGASGPAGVKSWHAKSQGPSSGGYSKPQQALERAFNQMTRDRWPQTQGSELIKEIAHIAAEYVGAPKPNGRGVTIRAAAVVAAPNRPTMPTSG